MIYNGDYFKQEIRKTYFVNKNGKSKFPFVCLFLSLFCFAFNSLFVALRDTVIGDFFPHLSNQSFFSIISILNIVAPLFFIVYYIYKYNTLTFAEIDRNRWYMLRKMGYSIRYMVLSKQTASILMGVFVYLGCYVCILLISAVLGYSVSAAVFLPLLILGLIQLFAVIDFIMLFSLILKKPSLNFIVTAIAVLIVLVSKTLSGFSEIESSFANMQKVSSLFMGIPSIYIYCVLVLEMVLFSVTTLISAKQARFYYPKYSLKGEIIYIDYLTNKRKVKKAMSGEKQKKIVKVVFSVLMMTILLFGVLGNVFIMVMGTKTNGEFSIFGYVPFIFGSETMKTEIEKNDFVLFEQTNNKVFAVGDVIMYDNNGETAIKIIVEIDENGKIIADILSYPASVETGAYKTEVKPESIKAVKVFVSRWLGAWFSLNNSIGGKVLILGVPLIVLAFYEQLRKFFALVKQSFET